ncbi:recombinase family protein [Mesorhizobium sp. B3-1-3]|nr:recombinase family protein [Mesorhizobium sp. B3-1-8]TPI61451.1 recombinase family protein [Mesorhizobium sp. B3-1-3]
MKYGYARVSTDGQDLGDQLDRLKAAGCECIYHEKISGKDAQRPRLQAMLRQLRTGDQVLAIATDRVARNPLDLLTVLRVIQSRGAGLRLLDEPFIDTTSEMADLIMFVVGWAAHWQRHNILRCTAIGRERAMARGVKFGRKPKLTQYQRQTIAIRSAAGVSIPQLAVDFNVSESTIRRATRVSGASCRMLHNAVRIDGGG